MTRLPSLGPRGEGWVLVQGALLVLVAAAGWSLGPDWSGPLRLAGVIVGIVLIAGGIVLAFRGVVDLGGALTPLPRPRDEAELVETGAYALVRHPIYGGLILMAFGWAIAQASIVAVALAAVLAGFLLVKSEREEAWLRQRFPAYAAYRARTQRLLPWPRRHPK
ncbi:MAG TPA: isoprenylcysteine carboxylmethyltransferase family protein [Candidatus Limnocylindria bacterium]|nr:isoprenylcysteine carboxylmethyltransferase family protein [Candidatus Limnocylindria bacterium]